MSATFSGFTFTFNTLRHGEIQSSTKEVVVDPAALDSGGFLN